MNVLAGLKLYGKNPTIAPAKAVIRIIAIIGDWFIVNTIIREKHDINVIPDDRPSKPSIRLIAFVMPTIQKTDRM